VKITDRGMAIFKFYVLISLSVHKNKINLMQFLIHLHLTYFKYYLESDVILLINSYDSPSVVNAIIITH